MTLSDKLSKIEGKYHKSMVKNVTIILTTLLKSRTTNLYKMKDSMADVLGVNSSESGSYYRYLIRFFQRYASTNLFLDILLWVLSQVVKEEKNLFLDGTEWQIGKFKLHILVLAAQFKGVVIPVYFKTYEHKGVLSEIERINFIKEAHDKLKLEGKLLLADREFIGKQWFKQLTDLGIHFGIRLRKGVYQNLIENYAKLERKALKKGYAQTLFNLDSQTYRLEMAALDTGKHTGKERIIYLITNVLDGKPILNQYKKRWKIEYCFKHLKSNGFNLEDISMTCLDKIKLMLTMVITAYTLAIEEGIVQEKRKKIRVIKYKNGDKYPAISTFRNGLQALLNTIQTYFDLDNYILNLKPKKTNLCKPIP